MRESCGDTIDRAAVLARLEGDVELLHEIVALFLEDCPRRLAALRVALAQHDSEALALAAHSLKGSLSNFSARRAVAAALRVETMARAGDLTHAEAACAALEREVACLMPALAAIERADDDHVQSQH